VAKDHMTEEEFTALVNGPLKHPLFGFRLVRLAMALRKVMDAGGEPAAEALRTLAREYSERDSADD
jgi:hypothetical protein